MTTIEWTEKTWNPIVGCEVTSPGCKNCYAMSMAGRLQKMNPHGQNGYQNPYHGTTKHVNGKTVWTGKIGIASVKALTAPLRRRKPTKYFVNSMGDLFHPNVPDAEIDKVFAVMALCPEHIFQVLTKHPERMRMYVGDLPRRHAGWKGIRPMGAYVIYRRAEACAADLGSKYGGPSFAVALVAGKPKDFHRQPDIWPLPNVWLGVSVEDQTRANERIPLLLGTPAAVRFISAEPLLGPVSLTDAVIENDRKGEWHCNFLDTEGLGPEDDPAFSGATLDWVIVGGESGPGARPIHPDWARSLRDQCVGLDVPFFFKQWGEWASIYDRDFGDPDWRFCDLVAQDTPKGRWINLEGGHGFHGERVCRVDRMGKKAAGRLLDGREWNQTPGEVPE